MKPSRFVLAVLLALILTGSMPASSQDRISVPGSVQPPPSDRPAVIFYADPSVDAAYWQRFFSALHRELALASPSDRLPATARMVVAGDRSVDPGVSSFIVVHLEGRCDQPRQAWRPLPDGAPLGWVYKTQGQIQPFIFVDCARIAQLLDPITLGMSNNLRVEAMDTAVARVLLHEWIHISLQTAEHTEHGIRQPRLSARDLTATNGMRASRVP
jgi:hypothetical protein